MEPWRTKLAEGDSENAWRLFTDRYRRLMVITIRRTVDDDDSVAEVFAHVCDRLSADGLARLLRYDEAAARGARFSTWLLAVVHNLTVDWVRQRDGRRRVRTPAGLSSLQKEIFERVFIERRPHTEAYELIRSSATSELTFGSFLRELAQTYRVVERSRPRGAVGYLSSPPLEVGQSQLTTEDVIARAELGRRLSEALGSLPPEERLGVQLFVVEELAAVDVARILGWPNEKAVYNRIYRALGRLRRNLEKEGIGPTDL